MDSKYFILFIRAFYEQVESQTIWFHWMVCVSIYDLIEWAGLSFTMIGIFIQFQLSDQHSSVMSVKMCRCIILLYGGIMPGGHRITLDERRITIGQITRTNVSHWLSHFRIANPCWPFEDSHFNREPHICPFNSHHLTCLFISDRRSHFHRAPTICRSAHILGSEYQNTGAHDTGGQECGHFVTHCDITFCDRLWHCMTVCDNMLHFMTICDSLWQCVTVSDS